MSADQYSDTQLLTEEEGQAAQYIRCCAAPTCEEDVEEAVRVLVNSIKELRLSQSREEVTQVVPAPRDLPLMADEDPPNEGNQ